MLVLGDPDPICKVAVPFFLLLQGLMNRVLRIDLYISMCILIEKTSS